jgi:glycosyltransferase involved in cell wall biosynthesis
MSILAKSKQESEKEPRLKVAYIMSRFPKITETFILYEMLALEDLGVKVELFPLLREYQKVAHSEAQKLIPHAHFHPFLSLKVLWAQWYYIRRKPKTYFGLWGEVLKSTFGSLNFFVGAIGIFPKSVRFAYEMEKLNVSNVHAHFASHPAVAAFIINRLTGIPYSFTAHGSDLHVERRMLDKKVAAASFAVTVSSYNKELMVAECGEKAREKIHVIHCGVDPNLFRLQPKTSNPNPIQILCVASFEEVKGHKFLVEACRNLTQRGVNFVCHLVGLGPLRRTVEAQIHKAGLTDHFRLHGGLSRPDIIKLHTEADVFVLPSVPTKNGKREGIPIVLMEAMSSGLPVVSSDLSGIPELVENGTCGILLPPRDVQALADALKKLCNDAMLRKKMGRNGRKRILEKFDLSKNAFKLLNLIKISANQANKKLNPCVFPDKIQ